LNFCILSLWIWIWITLFCLWNYLGQSHFLSFVIVKFGLLVTFLNVTQWADFVLFRMVVKLCREREREYHRWGGLVSNVPRTHPSQPYCTVQSQFMQYCLIVWADKFELKDWHKSLDFDGLLFTSNGMVRSLKTSWTDFKLV